MKIYTFKDFLDIVRKDITPLSLEEFKKTPRLGLLWNKMDSDDIRRTTLKTVDKFYEWAYKFLMSDEALQVYFQKRLEYRENVEVNYKQFDDFVYNRPNNVRFIRNINLKAMLNTASYDGKTIHGAYKNALERGIVLDVFTIPSVFRNIESGNYGTWIVTFKTKIGQPSVFSPELYKSLLKKTHEYVETGSSKQKLLIPSASWCSPILATQYSEDYSDIHIVDVQCDVLETCESVYDKIHPYNPMAAMLGTEQYDLKTFCIPSERMTEQIDSEGYDKVFFCPPYYDLELYGGSDEQSTILNESYEEWLENYWEETVNQCDSVLKPGAVFSFVMGKQIRHHAMGHDMMKIASKRFKLVKEIKILPPLEANKDSNKIEKYEICYIMKKEK
jgi:tRNA1(Val) A37 N6-methylase TrmN6